MTKHKSIKDICEQLEKLKLIRSGLVYRLADEEWPRDDFTFSQLAELQSNIIAYEAVIASGAIDPRIEGDAWIKKWLSSGEDANS